MIVALLVLACSAWGQDPSTQAEPDLEQCIDDATAKIDSLLLAMERLADSPEADADTDADTDADVDADADADTGPADTDAPPVGPPLPEPHDAG